MQNGRDGGQPLRPGGVGEGRDPARRLAEREQRVAALLGRRPRVRGDARGAITSSVPAALRRTTTASVAVGAELAGLEAQAGVEAGEPRPVGEAAGAPLLVDHGQQASSANASGSRGQLAQHPEREHHAALHVDGPRADQPAVLARQRPVVGVGDHGVEMAEQQQLAGARAADRRQQVGGMAGERARRPLDLRLVGHQRRDREQSSSAPRRSPEGEETATIASSSRSK